MGLRERSGQLASSRPIRSRNGAIQQKCLKLTKHQVFCYNEVT